MKDLLLRELVDEYLLGQISPERKKKLESLMAGDPVVAEYVKESEETFRILQSARNRQLREKMRAWDAAFVVKQKGKGNWLKLTLGLLVSILLIGLWLVMHFSPQSIAGRCFEQMLKENSFSVENINSWEEGVKAFRDHDYQKAILAFEPSLQEQFAYRAQWNILLSQLALQGSTPRWRSDLSEFSKRSPEPFHSAAKNLEKLLQSPMVVLLNSSFMQGTFTSVKPKII